MADNISMALLMLGIFWVVQGILSALGTECLDLLNAFGGTITLLAESFYLLWKD